MPPTKGKLGGYINNTSERHKRKKRPSTEHTAWPLAYNPTPSQHQHQHQHQQHKRNPTNHRPQSSLLPSTWRAHPHLDPAHISSARPSASPAPPALPALSALSGLSGLVLEPCHPLARSPTSPTDSPVMSLRSPHQTYAAFCEEFDEDANVVIPDTRKVANVATKRSKPDLLPAAGADGASDSGYSSRTAATVGSGDSLASATGSSSYSSLDNTITPRDLARLKARFESTEREKHGRKPKEKIHLHNPDPDPEPAPAPSLPTENMHASTSRGGPSRPTSIQRAPSKSRKRESGGSRHAAPHGPGMCWECNAYHAPPPPPPPPGMGMDPRSVDSSAYFSQSHGYDYPPTPQQQPRYPPLVTQEMQQASSSPAMTQSRPRRPSSNNHRPASFHQGVMPDPNMMYMSMGHQPAAYNGHGPPLSSSAYANSYMQPPYMGNEPTYSHASPHPSYETNPQPPPPHYERPRASSMSRPVEKSSGRRQSIYGPPVVEQHPPSQSSYPQERPPERQPHSHPLYHPERSERQPPSHPLYHQERSERQPPSHPLHHQERSERQQPSHPLHHQERSERHPPNPAQYTQDRPERHPPNPAQYSQERPERHPSKAAPYPQAAKPVLYAPEVSERRPSRERRVRRSYDPEDYYRMPPPPVPAPKPKQAAQVIPIAKRPTPRKATTTASSTPTIHRPQPYDMNDMRDALPPRVGRSMSRGAVSPERRPSAPSVSASRSRTTSYHDSSRRGQVTVEDRRSRRTSTYGALDPPPKDFEQKQREAEEYQAARTPKPAPLTVDTLRKVSRSQRTLSESDSQDSQTDSSRESDLNTRTASHAGSRADDDGITMIIRGVKIGFSSDAVDGKSINLRSGEEGGVELNIEGRRPRRYLAERSDTSSASGRREIEDVRRLRDDRRSDRDSRHSSRSGYSGRGLLE